MGRTKTPKGKRVKCRATGEFGTTLTFYKSKEGKYYKSEEIYKAFIGEQEAFLDCKRVLGALLEFNEAAPYPALLIKKINEFKPYTFARLAATIRAKEKDIRWACENKKFDNTQRKIQYVFRILSNAINDIKIEAPVEDTHTEITIDDYNMDIPLQSTQKVKDMSMFFTEV